jgi:hypothetical protein
MKVSMARIRLFLKEGKTLADGTHPIMLMCSFNGKCTRSTGYSCSLKYWDKKGECVKKGYPNFVIINHEIQKMKNDAIAVRNQYEALGEAYTADMVLRPRKVLCAVRNDLNSLIEQYIDEKGLENKTIEKWNIVKRNVRRFYGRDIIINEVDESFCRRYGRWMESEGLSSGSIKSYMGKIVAILHYAVAKGIIEKYPLDGWKYHKEYRESKSELYIHHRSMEFMMEMLYDKLVERNGSMWHYREGVIEELVDIHSSLYGLYLYCIGYYMKGLAPVDISMLKKKDIKVIMVKGKNCYAIDGHRSKTGMLYKIRLLQNCFESNVLIQTMLMFNDGEYFLPTLKGYVGKDMKKRVNNLYTYHGEHLVEWFQRVNEVIVRHNVEENDNVPLIDLSCRYYSYRHSYVMSQIQQPNVNLLKIATETGKSVKTIHQYVSLLNDDDLI